MQALVFLTQLLIVTLFFVVLRFIFRRLSAGQRRAALALLTALTVLTFPRELLLLMRALAQWVIMSWLLYVAACTGALILIAFALAYDYLKSGRHRPRCTGGGPFRLNV